MNYTNLDELNNLSEKEKKLALKILEEYSKQGSSTKLNELIYSDYEEIPVSIKDFSFYLTIIDLANHITDSGQPCKHSNARQISESLQNSITIKL